MRWWAADGTGCSPFIIDTDGERGIASCSLLLSIYDFFLSQHLSANFTRDFSFIFLFVSNAMKNRLVTNRKPIFQLTVGSSRCYCVGNFFSCAFGCFSRSTFLFFFFRRKILGKNFQHSRRAQCNEQINTIANCRLDLSSELEESPSTAPPWRLSTHPTSTETAERLNFLNFSIVDGFSQ